MKIVDIKLAAIQKKKIYTYKESGTDIREVKSYKDLIPENSGYFLISGKIKIADGTVYPALLGIDSDSSGELSEAYFLVGNKLVNQHDKGSFKLIRKKESLIFPYKYHLDIEIEGDKNLENQF